MEKKKYEELELEVVRLDGSDVITTSGDGCLEYCTAYNPPSAETCSGDGFSCVGVS